jgi:hypothetical protein
VSVLHPLKNPLTTIAGSGEITRADTKKRGMILPFTPLTITFDNIKYSVDMPQVSNIYHLFLMNITGEF